MRQILLLVEPTLESYQKRSHPLRQGILGLHDRSGFVGESLPITRACLGLHTLLSIYRTVYEQYL